MRFRVTGRGPRVSLGPRIARAHVGGGGTAVSTGSGPLTVWSTLSGGGRSTGHRDGAGSSRSDKADAWQQRREALAALLGAHGEEFELATRPVVPVPPPLDEAAVRRELRRAEAVEVAWWNLVGRWRARQRADARLAGELARRAAERSAQHAAAQAEADDWWQRLVANDPDLVRARVDEAFADNPITAAVAAVEGDRLHAVVSVDGPEELIGEREPKLTDLGNLSLAKLSKTRQQELYAAALTSSAVAVAAEAFAVAPGLRHVDVAVVRPEVPAVVALAELARDVVLPAGATRADIDAIERAWNDGEQLLELDRGGRTDAVEPLDPDDPDVSMVLDSLDIDDDAFA